LTDAAQPAVDALHLAKVETFVFRYPLRTPVRTSFGTMHDRPALLVRVEDRDGAHGWGEVWCNFPACGAEHRGRLVDSVMAPLLCGGDGFASPQAAFVHLSQRSAVLALQSGEPGPMAQAIAGVDLALWDLRARRAGQPLWRLLGGTVDRVGVYASGINPEAPHEMVARKRADGYRAFKLKVGFGASRDLGNLRRVRDLLGSGVPLMIDANQGWDLDTALRMVHQLAPFELDWLEEPLRADRPWPEWQALAQRSAMPLAAGENLAGESAFEAMLAAGAVRVIQPDAAKWGGLSGGLPVIRRAQAAGLRYCPHYLGGGVGLLHSAHLLAAVGGDGLLEVDANDNPLRTLLAPHLESPGADGRVALGDAPGIGVEPDLAALRATCALQPR
jgi:D-galactarolactone cycloisomerase